jgi:hypothetical protein
VSSDAAADAVTSRRDRAATKSSGNVGGAPAGTGDPLDLPTKDPPFAKAPVVIVTQTDISVVIDGTSKPVTTVAAVLSTSGLIAPLERALPPHPVDGMAIMQADKDTDARRTAGIGQMGPDAFVRGCKQMAGRLRLGAADVSAHYGMEREDWRIPQIAGLVSGIREGGRSND